MRMKWIIRISICVCIATFLVLAWCKLDGVQVIHAGYGLAESDTIHDIMIAPYLLPHTATRTSGGLFRYRLTWSGPYMFRVSLRDFGKSHEEARISAVRLHTPDRTWQQELVPPDTFGDWRDFAVQSWTDKFTEAVFIATTPNRDPNIHHYYNLYLPDEPVIVVGFELELKSPNGIEKVIRQYDLRLESKKTHGSYLVAMIISE